MLSTRNIIACSALGFTLLLCDVYSQGTSYENVNPFNELMRPEGGVNLFSGDAVHQRPLLTLPGRGGLSVPITLAYSSNIRANVRSSNDVAPTGWLGLGWALGFGSISINHKGTMTHADDEFYLVSGAGASQRLYEKDGKYIPKNQPYVSFEPIDNDGNGIYEGWVTTSLDGSKTYYGDCDFTDAREATRHTLCSGQLVGATHDAAASLYPYTWDVSEMRDRFGNRVKFEYQQVREYVDINGTKSLKQYTKESHIERITSPEGKVVEFTLGTKNAKEYVDVRRIKPEPDGHIEMLETQYLSSVSLKNSLSGPEVLKFELDYLLRGDHLGDIFTKRYLQSIRRLSGDSESLVESYAYNLNAENASSGDYHYGALFRVMNSQGGFIDFKYKEKAFAKSRKLIRNEPLLDVPEGNGMSPGMNSDGVPYLIINEGPGGDRNFLYRWDGDSWEPRLWGVNGSNLDMKFRKQGIPGLDYFVIKMQDPGYVKDYLWAYDWNGINWEPAKYRIGPSGTEHDFARVTFTSGTPGQYRKTVYPGKDYMVVTCAHSDNNKRDHMYLFQKKGDVWESISLPDWFENGNWKYRTGAARLNHVDQDKHVICLENHCLVAYASALTFLHRVGDEWQVSNIKKDSQIRHLLVHDLGVERPKKLYPHGDYVVSVAEEWGKVSILVWNGTEWEMKKVPAGLDGAHKVYSSSFGINAGKRVATSPDHIAIACKHRVWILNRNGNEWDVSPEFDGHILDNGYEKRVYFVNDNTVYIQAAVDGDDGVKWSFGWMYMWDGTNWQPQAMPPGFSSGGASAHVEKALTIGRDYFAVSEPQGSGSVWVFRFNGEKWDYTTLPFNATDAPKEAWACNTFFVVRKNLNSADARQWVYLWMWNGKEWEQTYSDVNFGYKNVKKYWSLGDNLFISDGSEGGRIWGLHRFQNSFEGNLLSNVLIKKTAYAVGADTKPLSVFYEYDKPTASFDTRIGTAKFNKVGVRQGGSGKTVKYFFNDTEADNQNTLSPDYMELDGLSYRSEVYNEENSDSELDAMIFQETEYELAKEDDWPMDVQHKRVVGGKKVNTEVTTKTEIGYNIGDLYTEGNGMPRLTAAERPTGERDQNFTLFAHEVPEYTTALTDDGMLAQPALSIKLRDYDFTSVTNKDWYKTIAKENIAGASATTWQSTSSGWMPEKTYVWNSIMDAGGTPVNDFKAFDFSKDGSGNAANGWLWTRRNVRFNAHGQLLQAESPNGGGSALSTVTIYRNDNSRTQATVVNAQYTECAAFTCDYDMKKDGYFDKMNGWEKSGAVVKDCPVAFFGDNAVYVDLPVGSKKFGPSRNVAILPNTDYIMSAWVYVEDGELLMHGDYRHRGEGDVLPFVVGGREEGFTAEAVSAEASNHWQYIELKIQASKDLTETEWAESSRWAARVFVGSPNGVKGYIQDIRFFPADAQVNTVYYDEKWEKPQVSVDANGKPGTRVTFDDFGRPIKWEDAKLSNGVFEGWRKQKEQEYYLVTDLPEGLQLGFLGGVPDYFEVGKRRVLGWAGDIVRLPELYLSTDGGTTWETTEEKAESPTKFGSFAWTAPVYAAGKDCMFKLVDQNESSVTLVSEQFEVGYNNRLYVGTEPGALSLLARPKGGGYYTIGQVIDLSTPQNVDLLLVEYEFVRWNLTAGDGTFDDATQRKTEFTVSGYNEVDLVAVEAVYRKK